VGEHRQRELLDVFGDHEVPTAQRGAGAAGPVQAADVTANEAEVARAASPSGQVDAAVAGPVASPVGAERQESTGASSQDQPGAPRAEGGCEGPGGVGSQDPPQPRPGASSADGGAWARRRAALVADGEILRGGTAAAVPDRRQGEAFAFTSDVLAELNRATEQQGQPSTSASLLTSTPNDDCKNQ
jgi:hypothetical protein